MTEGAFDHETYARALAAGMDPGAWLQAQDNQEGDEDGE